MTIVLLLLAVLIGLALGMLGGGGAILTLPLLTLVAGMDTEEAGGGSLLVVGASALLGVLLRRGHGLIRWRAALLLGGGGVLGAQLGQLAGSLVPSAVVMVVVGLVMVTSAILMLRRRAGGLPPSPERGRARMPWPRMLAIGAGVGVLTGFVGAGGGFLLVPALVMLAGLSMPAAVATSLVVIAANSASGLAGHLLAGGDLGPVVLGVAAAALAGTAAGTHLAGRVPAPVLQRGFAVLVLLVAVTVLGEEAMRCAAVLA